jgi:ABC-type methionine transport system ATPase subunit
MGSALALAGIYQHVGGRAALASVDLEVAAGDWLLLVGRNGAGKSLLVRLLLGLDSPSAGSVRVLGEDIGALGRAAMTRLRARVGAVLQGGSLLNGHSVLENILIPLRGQPGGPARLAREARLVLSMLRLDGLESYCPRALSLGQRRLVELARALIHRPELLIWDGLTDGLDPASAAETLKVLSELRQTRKLTLIATDNDPGVLGADCDRIAVLERGRILFSGTSADLALALPRRLDLRYALTGRV